MTSFLASIGEYAKKEGYKVLYFLSGVDSKTDSIYSLFSSIADYLKLNTKNTLKDKILSIREYTKINDICLLLDHSEYFINDFEYLTHNLESANIKLALFMATTTKKVNRRNPDEILKNIAIEYLNSKAKRLEDNLLNEIIESVSGNIKHLLLILDFLIVYSIIKFY